MSTAAWALWLMLALLAVFLAWRWRRAVKATQHEWQRALLAAEEAERTVRENERLQRYLAAVQQAGGNAIFLVDGEHTVLWLNDSARDHCVAGVTPPLPLSKAITSYELLDVADRALHASGPHERQFNRNDHSFYARAEVVDTDPTLVVIRVRDVTELQRLGRARRDFVANISHDLRTPITAIQIMVETLQAGVDHPRQRKTLLDSIADQTTALRQLAQELLDLSLIESGRMPLRLVEIAVSELIEPVAMSMQTQATSRGLHVHTDYDASLMALADPDSVRRVLQNLTHNALKFSESGQTVVLGAKAAGDDICFFVQDSGRGIDEADLQRIFERFYKSDRMRAETGTGLGLAIARHIVEGHGGRIWAESELGKGATFYFTVPRA